MKEKRYEAHIILPTGNVYVIGRGNTVDSAIMNARERAFRRKEEEGPNTQDRVVGFRDKTVEVWESSHVATKPFEEVKTK